jgi:hypothetical protein
MRPPDRQHPSVVRPPAPVVRSPRCYPDNAPCQPLLSPPGACSFDLAGLAGGAYPPAFQFTLVLRKFSALNPGMEFRCFVRGQRLIGASYC